MNIPQAAITVSANETLKILLRPKDGHNMFSYLACAAAAGNEYSTLYFPYLISFNKKDGLKVFRSCGGSCDHSS